jgi:hypothetical protein
MYSRKGENIFFVEIKILEENRGGLAIEIELSTAFYSSQFSNVIV